MKKHEVGPTQFYSNKREGAGYVMLFHWLNPASGGGPGNEGGKGGRYASRRQERRRR